MLDELAKGDWCGTSLRHLYCVQDELYLWGKVEKPPSRVGLDSPSYEGLARSAG
jgi:hypothetical protein